MSITANSLYYDTKNFLSRELFNIIRISLFIAIFTVIITNILLPDIMQQLSFLNHPGTGSPSLFKMMENFSPEQQTILLRTSIIQAFIILISNSMLLGGTIIFIQSISNGNKIDVLQAIRESISFLPKLALQTFFITLLIQLGCMTFIIPGIFAAIMFSLAPVILVNKKTGVIKSIYNSLRFSWKNIKLISPAIIFHFLVKTVLIYLFLFFKILPINIISLIFYALGNIVSAILTIYLYRLHILLN